MILVNGLPTNIVLAANKVLSVNNTLTLAGTDSTTMTFPATSATIARTDAANTFTGVQTMTSPVLTTPNIGVASATSINFGGTTFANYVEGTWTPAISTDATAGTPAYTTQVGSYERVGRQVTARFNILLSGWTGSPTGNAVINGLPLTSSSTANDQGIGHVGSYSVSALASLSYGLSLTVAVNGTQIFILQNNNANTAQVTAAQFGAAGSIRGVVVYHV